MIKKRSGEEIQSLSEFTDLIVEANGGENLGPLLLIFREKVIFF